MPIEAHTLAVKQRAAALGFDACGVAEAGAVATADRFEAWLGRGYHAEMLWLERTRALRADIRKKLPGAQSVVVVARNYYAPRPAPDAAEAGTGEPMGRVSRYAWGRDYHRVLAKPLAALAAFITESEPDAAGYCCVDTGPVAERYWAMQAGIGWVGKNSLIVRRSLGSWLFLGVVITTVKLRPDRPAEDRCGTCRRCIEACPTGAIVAPGVVDARKCIAYHTVENRGSVPDDLAPGFRDWVFGCDACQEVCPWNRFARVTSASDFHPRPGHAFLDLVALAGMDEAGFNEQFAGSPIRRAKLSGMQRNARVVRSNLDGSARGNR